jgi:hypothetical protein
MKTSLCFALLAALLAGCGTPGRPVGVPPPEYEEPHVEPWPPASAEAAKPAAPLQAPAPSGSADGVGPAPEVPAGAGHNSGGSGARLSPGTP